MYGCGTQSMERKDDARIDTMNQLGVNKKKKTDRVVVDKKKNVDDDPQSVQQKNATHLEKNQTALIENKKISDYESKFEASRKRLHKAYKHEEEAKQKSRIEVIDFQKSETQGSNGKAKRKPSLRQRFMAMPTRKSKKKFPSYELLSSCN
ncbi:hypothetical protein ACET3Z_021902 [Daucus carota]